MKKKLRKIRMVYDINFESQIWALWHLPTTSILKIQ